MQLNKRGILVLFWCVFFLISTVSSWANETEETSSLSAMLAMSLEELIDIEVVSATGISMPVRLAPAVASVISASQIEAMGATTLDEILESVPGLHVTPSPLAYFSAIWSFRGIHTVTNPHALLLINGIPITDIQVGGRPLISQMPVAMISRIEVVRGPGSAVHGADAFSGTVNVITKDGNEIDGTEAGIRYGSFNTSDLWIQHGGQYKGWDFYASVETQNSDGDNNRVVEQDFLNTALGGAYSAFSNTPAHLNTKYDRVTSHLGFKKDKLNLRLYGAWNEDIGQGPGALQTITYGGSMDTRQLMADLEYRDKKFASDLDLSLRLFYINLYGNNFFEFFPPAMANSGHPVWNYWLGNPIVEHNQSGFESTVLYEGIQDHKLRLSLGWKFYDMDTDQFKNYGPAVPVADRFGPMINIKDTSDLFLADQRRKLWNVSLQDEWSINQDWTFTGGLRYDYYDDFGSTTNPRAALVWETKYDLITKLMYGRAFRAPSFGEQYTSNNPQALGNPDIEPETIDTYELAFDYQPTATLRTKLNLFTYDIDGLIEKVSDPAPATTKTTKNAKDQEGHGFEVEMHWEPIKSLRVLSTFAYQRSKDKNTKEIVPDTPEKQFYLNPHWIFMPDWSLDGQFYWIAGRHRANGDPRDEIDDYELVNLTIRRKNIGNCFDMAVSVRNLFDEDVREPSPYAAGAGAAGAFMANDYPMESRAIWAEIRTHF